MDTQTPNTDIKINCSNGVLYYCKYMLQRVPYYDTMINGGFAESNTNEVNFEYETAAFLQIVEFIEKGGITLTPQGLYYNVYRFALITNYDSLKNYIVKSQTINRKFASIAMKHHHHEMLKKLKTLMHWNKIDKLKDGDLTRMYKYITEHMPIELEIFQNVEFKYITKEIVQLALKCKDKNILHQIVKILKKFPKNSDRMEFMKGFDVSIIKYGFDTIYLTTLWVKANEEDKNKVIDEILTTDIHGVTSAPLLKLIYLFIDDNESLKKLLNIFWNKIQS